MKVSTYASKLGLRIPISTLTNALEHTNQFLRDLPGAFPALTSTFYPILNQRNISGFVGEVLKHSICAIDSRLVPNPHPDGRPDLLEISQAEVARYLKQECLAPTSGAAIRAMLAPFAYGGIEIKCTIGKVRGGRDKPVGAPRVSGVTGLNYWAHHAHGCDLLGIYYDYVSSEDGAPQIKACFYLPLRQSDWHKVSTGDPNKKKTSNTSLNSSGVKHLYNSLVIFEPAGVYEQMLKRIGVSI